MDDRLTETMRAAMPFAGMLEVEGLSAGDGMVVARLAWAPERCTAGGVLHGGALMTLADATAATCAYLALPTDATGTSTIESKTNFLRPVRSGSVTATAEIVHAGTDDDRRPDRPASDDDGQLVARTLQTQAVLRGS